MNGRPLTRSEREPFTRPRLPRSPRASARNFAKSSRERRNHSETSRQRFEPTTHMKRSSFRLTCTPDARSHQLLEWRSSELRNNESHNGIATHSSSHPPQGVDRVPSSRARDEHVRKVALASTEYAKTLPKGTPRGHNVGSHAFVRTADSDVVFE